MAANRNYSSVARQATLGSGISGSSTVVTVDQTTGFPTTPFTLVIDPGRAQEEIVTVTAQVGLNLTIARGQDGSTAVPHDAGATLRHMATARDYRDAAEHIGLTAGVHGISGDVVGATDDQTLDNKTFTPIGTDHTAIVIKAGAGQSAPLLIFQEPGGTSISQFNANGSFQALNGLNVVGQFAAQAATTVDVPLSVKGAASQSGHLASFKNSSNTELSFVGPDGSWNGPVNGTVTGTLTGAISSASIINSGTITSTGQITSSGVVQGTNFIGTNGQTAVTTANVGQVPMVITSPTGHTVSALAVRDQATNASRAGIWGESGVWQLYHGGDPANHVPFKIRSGITTVHVANGDNQNSVSISFPGSVNFDVTPMMVATINGYPVGSGKLVARVSAVTTSGCTIWAVVPDGSGVTAAVDVTIGWIAIQSLPTSAAG